MSSFEEEYLDNDCKCNSRTLKIIELLESAKLIIERLINDVCHYAHQLQNLQDCYQNCNLNCDGMFECLETKLDKLTQLFFWGFDSHLSITTNCIGVGNKIIRPVNQEFGYVTTLKMQNINKECDKCISRKRKFLEKKNGILKLKDYLKIQINTNIATYDNISISKQFDSTMTEDLVSQNNTKYIIHIGNLSYELNSTFGNIKNAVRFNRHENESDECSYDENHIINKKSIDELFNFIDIQIETLANIEVSLNSNIIFIDKYIKNIKE